MKQRVVLINPPKAEAINDLTGGGLYWPIPLAILYEILSNKYIVSAIDMFSLFPMRKNIRGNIVRYGLEIDLIDMCVKKEDIVIVYSGHTIGHSTVLDLISEINKCSPKKILVVENTNYVNAYPLDRFRKDFEDLGAEIILGDPYDIILDAIDGNYDTNKRYQIKDVDSIPIPNWYGFNIDNYWDLPFAHAPKSNRKYIQMYTSLGCNGTCLAGDTLINTVEGMIPIKDLVGRDKIGVYTYDRETGEALISDATNIRKTGAKDLVRVTFDDGTHIDCTPDHKFICFKNGNQFIDIEEFEVEAEDLKHKQRVRALKESVDSKGYLNINWKRKGRNLKSRMIMEYIIDRKLLSSEIVHHINKNRLDNRIENLKLCVSDKEHLGTEHPELSERMKLNNPAFNMTDEWRKKITLAITGLKRTDEQKNHYKLSKLGDKNPNYKGGLPNCIDCGKKISSREYSRCFECNKQYLIGEKSSNWKGGKPKCVDCGVEIGYINKRCKKCLHTYQQLFVGENSPYWKGGGPKCIICGITICYVAKDAKNVGICIEKK